MIIVLLLLLFAVVCGGDKINIVCIDTNLPNKKMYIDIRISCMQLVALLLLDYCYCCLLMIVYVFILVA